LDLKVLDPAMGSGHFLVEATDYLARVLATDPYVQAGTEGDGGVIAPIAPPMAGGDESDLNYWQRRVVERCIYGVDKNPLAVELAKLSLWLTTFAGDRPLGFLDHHLKCGDSLVGARVEDLGSPPPVILNHRRNNRVAEGQLNLFAHLLSERLPVVMGKVMEIIGRESDSYESIRAKEAADRAMQRLKGPFEAVANLWLSAYFGNEYEPHVYQEALDWIHEPAALFMMDEVLEAEAMAEARRFFHWELVFPEVFFDGYGQPLPEEARGFDAVIGNPPYVPTEQIDVAVKAFLTKTMPVLYRKYDLSVAFSQEGFGLLARHGLLGMITPIAWETGENYDRFRKQVFVDSPISLLTIVNLPFDVFPEAYVDTCIVIWGKSQGNDAFRAKEFDKRAIIRDAEEIDRDADIIPLAYVREEKGNKLYLDRRRYEFLEKFKGPKFSKLGVFTDSCQGIVETFYEYEGQKKTGDYLPYYICDVYRYSLTVTDRKFIYFPEEENSLFKYYTQPRLLIRRLVNRQDRLMAVFSDEVFVVKKDLNPFVLEPDVKVSLLYLLANLNSKLHAYIYVNTSALALKDDFRQTTLAELAQLPIRCIDFATPEDARAQLLAEAQGLCEAGEYDALLGFVEARLAAEPQEADVVHDLLAYLAERMMALHERRQKVERALDPFKFLSRGVRFVTLTEVFAEALKYGARLPAPREGLDIDIAHHDIDGLRLVPEGDQWRLEVQCKLRDPADGWRSWQYEADARGHAGSIAREWVPVYRLPLDEAQGRYYQAAFRVLDEFVHAKSFPGGRTRTTFKKLQLTRVPAFEADVNLSTLVDLGAELAEVREGIAATDEVIDQIVYQLYGLTEEEIALVSCSDGVEGEEG
jgi:hypothetical protein